MHAKAYLIREPVNYWLVQMKIWVTGLYSQLDKIVGIAVDRNHLLSVFHKLICTLIEL